ncbi:MAG: YceI family protein [Rhodospirillales bacterium]
MTRFRLLAVLALAVGVGLPASAGAAERYVIDVASSHFYAGFKISHLGLSNIHGRFNKISGEILFDSDNPEKSRINVTVDTSSVDTNLVKRDNHLRSPDFFNVLEFPAMTFLSTKAEKTGENTGTVTGDLTIIGVTRSVTFDVTLNKAGPHPTKKEISAVGFSATGMIKRSDFGMKFGIGGIGDEVTLILEAEALR